MSTILKTWADCAAELIATAAGRKAAELVITNARVVNVHTREILDWQVAVTSGRFAYVGPDASHCIGDATQVIDGRGQYLIPGLCDGHMHIESGMLTPAEFARAVIPQGTTTMFVDPHEIANVLGLRGVRLMHDEALLQPCNIYVQMPSCAPSAPGLETTGFEITPDDVAEAMTWPGIIGLGEMMNFPGVINEDPKMLAEMAATAAAGKVIGGHYASPDLGPNFHAYVAGGPADDHEGTCEDDAIARVRQGMRSMMRLGSAWFDVAPQITAITERGLDPRNFILCTDDCHPGTLIEEGHMNRAVRHAIECGCDPLVALQLATINTATHFGLERELGSITPGRRADMILTDDLVTLPINTVFARGKIVAQNGEMQAACPHLDWPADTKSTVHLKGTITGQDFEIPAPTGASEAHCQVIGIVENQAPTQALKSWLPVRNGLIEGANGVAQVAVIERHRPTGAVANGFVSGYNYQGTMAMASTVAHDSHQMIVVGTCRDHMAMAANRLAEVGGGMCLWRDGAERAMVELPVAGLMSDAPAADVAAKAQAIVAAMRDCGCELNNANIQHSFLALVVIPALRISDKGLIDVNSFAPTELILETR